VLTFRRAPAGAGDAGSYAFLPDGIVLVKDGRVEAVGPTASLLPRLGGAPVDHFPDKLILPGFIDTPMLARVHGPKPLTMAPDRAARLIRRGLERGRSRIAFPLPLYWLSRAAMLLPGPAVDMFLNRFSVSVTGYE